MQVLWFVRNNCCQVVLLAGMFALAACFLLAPTAAAQTNEQPPQLPAVTSSVFASSQQWYATTNGEVSWTVPSSVTAVAVEIATSSDNRPQVNAGTIYEPPIDTLALDGETLSEGAQYLSIAFQNEAGWGPTLNRAIRIDTTPPEPFVVAVVDPFEKGAFPKLEFETTDALSGVDHYEVTIKGERNESLSPEAASAGYRVSALPDGTYDVEVVAVDAAGNERAAEAVSVEVAAGWSAAPTAPAQKQVAPPAGGNVLGSFGNPVTLFMFFLLVVNAIMFVILDQERRAFAKREAKLKRETQEVQEQTEKIFSALRDEIYDQISTITKRKKLSKKEQEAVDGLNQALEVSENLIGKEINDVKSALKK